MVNPWHKTRRSVEEDYRFYDSPEKVYSKLTQKSWEYKQDLEFYTLRDLAYMTLMYLSTCRASELCRADLDAGYKPSVTKNQFHFEGDLLKFREVIILKRRELVDGEWVHIQAVENYPTRNEIPLPLAGKYAYLSKPVVEYLEVLRPGEELFKFRYRRGWQIVNYVTGEMQHYLRDMGLKFYTRLLDRNLKDLIEFSGHARIQNLMRYLGEGQLESKLLEA